MTKLPATLALVDHSGQFNMATLSEVAAALSEQLRAHFNPEWPGSSAVVQAFQQAPPMTWEVRLVRHVRGALGYHTEANNQPYALVDASDRDWTVTASHEAMEMAADPHGNRPHTARLPWGLDLPPFTDPHERVVYLVEVADPPEANTYEVGGVAVSDFVMQEWYWTGKRAGVGYTFLGLGGAPRVVEPGGYVSFMKRDTMEWWQVFADAKGRYSVENLGRFDAAKRAEHGMLRAWTDAEARKRRPAVARQP